MDSRPRVTRQLRIDLLRPCATLALVPIVSGVAVTVGLAIPFFGQPEDRSILWLGSLAGLTGLSLIWLRVVRWTLQRCFGTASATAVLLVHLLLWQPVWNIGCLEDLLVFGQGMTLMGLWMWFVPLIWWGVSVRPRVSSISWTHSSEVPVMRVRAGDFMRAVALVPLVSGIWVIVFLVAAEFFGKERAGWIIANAAAASALAVGWIVAWQRHAWTQQNRHHTLLLSGALIAISGACGLIESSMDWVASLVITLPLILTGTYMIATGTLWRPDVPFLSGGERPHPTCPACGYDLTGLHEARCPECGRSYTLDELFSALSEPT